MQHRSKTVEQVIRTYIQVYVYARLSIDQLSTGQDEERKRKKSIIRAIGRSTTTPLTDQVFTRN
jgi:hypothetical protein